VTSRRRFLASTGAVLAGLPFVSWRRVPRLLRWLLPPSDSATIQARLDAGGAVDLSDRPYWHITEPLVLRNGNSVHGGVLYVSGAAREGAITIAPADPYSSAWAEVSITHMSFIGLAACENRIPFFSS
jgi:hypothetical protein